MMFWHGGGWVFWQVALMWAVMIAFWAVIIWAAYGLVTRLARKLGHGQGGEEHCSPDPRFILDERLARGEIGIDEYQLLRDAIAAGDSRNPAGAGSRQDHRPYQPLAGNSGPPQPT